MAFHFTLEAVLRYRQSLEDQELLRLQTLLAQRALLFSELEQLHQACLDLQHGTRRGMMLQPTPAVEIHFATARLNALDRQREAVQHRMEELQAAIVEQRSRFEQQRRNREVLEALRDGQLRDYRLAQRRREQARLDELHLLRPRARR